MRLGRMGLSIATPNRPRFGPDVFTSPAAAGTVGYTTYDAPTDKWTIRRDASGNGQITQSGFKASTSYLFTFDFFREGGEATFAIDIRVMFGTGHVGQQLLDPAEGFYSLTITTGSTTTAINFALPGPGSCGAYANIIAREIL